MPIPEPPIPTQKSKGHFEECLRIGSRPARTRTCLNSTALTSWPNLCGTQSGSVGGSLQSVSRRSKPGRRKPVHLTPRATKAASGGYTTEAAVR
jgi:hypothetical protein